MSRRRWIKHRPLFSSPVPVTARRPKTEWYIGHILWVALSRTCMVLGGFTLVIVVLIMLVMVELGAGQRPSLPGEMVLYLPLDDDPGEMADPVRLSDPFAAGQLTAHDLVDVIDRAATDPRVKGLLARMESGTYSLQRSQELRDAVKRFRETGKFATIYSTSYGQGAGDLGRYYLASAFGEIWMQPMGLVSIAGIRAEVPFVREALDKIGILPQFYHRKEYKTAYESFTNSKMSDANREETQALVDDIKVQLLKDIPADRGIKVSAFEQLVQHGLFTAQEALDKKLVTNLDYMDVLADKIKTDITGDPDADDDLFVDVALYAEDAAWESSEQNIIRKSLGGWRPKVALIYVVGAIMDSNVGGDYGVAAADEIAPAIHDAADDDNIQAIVIRIDSPGGSPVASETILRAIERAKQKGKPVIVSMGPTAASGGYWVAAYADQIFASPTTLTGSIGVLGGKVSASKLWGKAGVNWDKSVQWGKNAGLWSMNTPFSDSEAERINAMLDNVYAAFVARVAKGRGMTPEQVDKIAGGRVWTGMRAVKVGLVDQLGGLREALNYTAKILDEDSKDDLNVIIMPEPKGALEQLLHIADEQSGVYENMKFQQKIFSYFAPALRAAQVFEDGNGIAAYEPLRIE